MGRWRKVWMCEECRVVLPHRLGNYPPCPMCGADYPTYSDAHAARWHSHRVWWKPWTWTNGQWEIRT
jgi:hypothetical protein